MTLTGQLFPNQGEMDRLIMPHKEMYCPFFQYYKDATFSKESFNNKKKTWEQVTSILYIKFTSLIIEPYPGAPLSPAKGLKQDLVRMDDSFPCLDLLSFHEKLDTSTEFLMV